MVQTVENRITLPPTLEEEHENAKFLDLLSQMVGNVFHDIQDIETDRTVQDAMRSGHLTSYYTPSQIIMPDRTLQNHHMKSAWFKHSAHLGLEDPRVLNFFFDQLPDEDVEEYIKKNKDEVADLLARLGQQAYLWTISEKLTIFTAKPSGLKYLPEDAEAEIQESESGLSFMPGAEHGRAGKRLRCFSMTLGTFFDPKASFFPELNLGGEHAYRVKVRDSGTVGDGGGSCPLSIAREILQLSGAPLWGDMIAFQIVVLAADYSFKGLINIIPDELWTDKETDLLIDAKSVNHQVHSTKVTVGKLIPTRHKKNKRHFYVEPMNLGEVVNRFIGADQLVEQVQVIAENLDRETWDKVMEKAKESRESQESQKSQAESEDEIQEMLGDNIEEWDNLSHVQRAIREQPEEKKGLLLAYEESGRSPFGLPSLTSMAAEGPANSWASQLKQSRKKGGEWNPDKGKRDNSTLSGIIVSGEKLLLMDPKYAGTTYPRRGYVRLIWHPRHKDQLIGLGLSKADTLQLRDAFDGMDVDGDKLQLIPMRDERGTPLVLLMRSPMSIDGGACLRLTQKDAARIHELGYHFYRKTGDHKYPGLYHIKDGKQVYPDVMWATPHENPPRWSTDPDLMVQRTLEMNLYRGMMGMICLLAANLDYAGLYDPAEHKFNMSEGVINPALNGTGDSMKIFLGLVESIIQTIRKGLPQDRCIFPRIRKIIEPIFRERHPGEEFNPILTCQEHHGQWRRGQEGSNGFLRDQVNGRGLLAHGPAEWLPTKFRTKLYNLAVRSLEERTAIWAQKAQDEREIWGIEYLNQRQKEAQIATLFRDAKEAETAVLTEAYRKAVKTVDDLEPGQFMAAWIQATVSRSKRFKKFEPIRAGALLKLPPEEIQGFFRKGESGATSIIRTEEPTNIPSGTECYVDERQINGKIVYQLFTMDNGTVITDLKYEARHYLELNLETAGYLPTIQISRQKDSVWEQDPYQLILRVTNPQNA